MEEKEPEINLSEPELTNAGFTQLGKDRFAKTVKEYSKELFEKSIAHGNISKEKIREVTNDDVKAAAHSIANSYGKPKVPGYMLFVKLGQYVCTFAIGMATTYLEKHPTRALTGILVSFVIGLILFYIENVKSKS